MTVVALKDPPAAEAGCEGTSKELELAFPNVDCGHKPLAEFVIVQIRRPRTRTAGGLELIEDTRKTENDNTQVAKVVAIGPLAFCHRSSGTLWPGGAWYGIGAFVRCPKYGGDRWKVSFESVEPERLVGSILRPSRKFTDEVEFALFKDLDIRMLVTGDPLAVKAFI